MKNHTDLSILIADACLRLEKKGNVIRKTVNTHLNKSTDGKDYILKYCSEIEVILTDISTKDIDDIKCVLIDGLCETLTNFSDLTDGS